MKTLGLGLGLVIAAMGCATTQPFAPSAMERARFEETVRGAQSAANDGPHQISTLLAEAKSEFEYAQHLPKYPDRARAMAAKAQHDADAALRLAKSFVRPVRAPVTPPAIAATPAVAVPGVAATPVVAAADAVPVVAPTPAVAAADAVPAVDATAAVAAAPAAPVPVAAHPVVAVPIVAPAAPVPVAAHPVVAVPIVAPVSAHPPAQPIVAAPAATPVPVPAPPVVAAPVASPARVRVVSETNGGAATP